MGRGDLVLAIGADDQEMPAFGIGHQRLQKVERGRVRPLQVVDKDHERVVDRCKRPNEFAEHIMKAVLCLGAADLGHIRLGADDMLKARQNIGQNLPLFAQGLPKAFT